MTLKDALELLELSTPFTKAGLKKAYSQALMVWHPDRFPTGDELHARAHEKTRLIIEAFGYLSRALGADDSFPSAPQANPGRSSQPAPPPQPAAKTRNDEHDASPAAKATQSQRGTAGANATTSDGSSQISPRSPFIISMMVAVMMVAVTLFSSLFIFWVIGSLSQSEKSKAPQTDFDNLLESPSSTPKSVSWDDVAVFDPPPTGVMARYFSGEGTSPLKIVTPNNRGTHYFVKIVNTTNSQLVATVFVRGGTTAEVMLPSGRYEIRYAVGESWRDTVSLFGPRTAFSKADRTFDFADGRGYEVHLILQRNGNLSTRRIDEKDF